MSTTARLMCTILFTLALGPAAVPARAAQPAAEPAWQAQWIGLPTSATTNVWTCFRKSVDLGEKVPDTVPARIAVDSKYWLWINDKLAVFEGGLKRGPNPSDSWYDELDLARWLQPGRNTISILTTYWGVSGFSHNSSGKAGLVFEADLGGGRKLLSDSSWQAMLHPAFGLATQQPNERISERNILFDARKDPGEWWKMTFNENVWSSPTQYGVPPAAPWGKLWKRTIPQWQDYGLANYLNEDKRPRDSDGKPVVMKLPANMQVTPMMGITAPAGLKIEIRTDHKTVGKIPCVYAEYITRQGYQEFEAPAWMNGQEVIYDIPAGVKMVYLKYRLTGYRSVNAGLFRSDDPFLNDLWLRARQTLYINMRDNYFDCPDRERALWWGDVHIDLAMAFYALDRKADLLTQKSIYDLVRWARPDGVLHSPVPGNYAPELPAQMLASIGQMGFWTYYFYTGDKATLEAAWPAMQKYLALWKIGPDGLVVHRGKESATKDGPIWDWMDWGKDIDARLMDQGWYCLAMQGAANTARLLGDAAAAEKYEKARQGVIAAANKAFWNGTAYRDPAYKGATDDRGNALAVVAGIAGADKFAALRKVLAAEEHASPYMEKYCLEALFQMGATDEALGRMRKRFEPIMPAGLSTLPELFTTSTGTVNHAWSGGPLTLLSQYVGGIAPDEVGFAKFHILPRPGKMNEVNCQVLTVKGGAEVQFRREPAKVTMLVRTPQGTVARVGIPKNPAAPFTKVTLNRKTVWAKAGNAEKVAGLEPAGEDEQFLIFTVQPGEWIFTAE